VEEGAEMLSEVACLEAPSARNEVLRYTRTPTQPMSYAMGMEAIRDLREAWRLDRGAAFNLQEFHDRLLSYGSIPVSLIRQRLLEETPVPQGPPNPRAPRRRRR